MRIEKFWFNLKQTFARHDFVEGHLRVSRWYSFGVSFKYIYLLLNLRHTIVAQFTSLWKLFTYSC